MQFPRFGSIPSSYLAKTYLRRLMDILLKGTFVCDPSSPFHQQQVDVFIQNGIVTEIGSIDRQADEVIDLKGLVIAPGFTDIFAHFADPGYEFRETVQSGSLAAANGGFTDVFLLPNTSPVVSQKAGVEYIVRSTQSIPVNLHPIGAVTKNAEGKELAEMYDMYQSGAIAFSDGIHPIQSSGILLKALQYVKAIDRTIIQIPDDQAISAHGLMNEGVVSTKLGLAGKPAIAEELMINRDIELSRYTGSKIHFTGVSTAKGLDCIRKAKAEGLAVSCSVTPAHLYFTEDDLAEYDTNLKLTPPLRSAADRDALRQAVLDGTVDCIASHHLPHHVDNKVVEFEYAKPGMISLETAVGVVKTSILSLSIERLVELFSTAPRQVVGLSQPSIQLNEKACFTLLLPDQQWTPERFVSKSRNSPFFQKALTGLPVGIINRDNLFLKTLSL